VFSEISQLIVLVVAIKAKTTKTEYSSPLNKKQTTMHKMYNKNNISKTAAQLKTAENTQLDINQYFHFASAFFAAVSNQ